jgi:hypothetical protein
MGVLMRSILQRFSEPSSWASISAALVGLMGFTTDEADVIIGAGAALCAVMGIILKEGRDDGGLT